MIIESFHETNLDALKNLAIMLWPDVDFEDEKLHFHQMLTSDREICFVARIDKQYVAFIQLSIRRDYVEGATSLPVVYVEGIYVLPEFRNRGIASTLIRHGEQWGKTKGCTEIASDAELDNNDSILFHKRTGFKEANRVVCFIRQIE